MVTTTAAGTSTMQIVEYHVKYNTTTAQNPPEATVVVGVRVNIKKVTIVVTSTTWKHEVRVLLDHSHNKHLIFVTKDKPMLCPYSNRLVSQSWNTSNGIAQKCKLRGSWTSYTTPIAKVLPRTWCCWVRQDSDSKSSIQNLMQLSTVRLW
jgi:hypothetical protein